MVTSARAGAWVTPRRASGLAVAALVLSIALTWAGRWLATTAIASAPVLWAFFVLSLVSTWAAMAGVGAAFGLAPRKALGYAALAYLGIGLVVHLIMLSRSVILTWPRGLYWWVGFKVGVIPPPD